METYDILAAADPFARSRICFEHLAEDLSGGRAGQMTHDQLEELIEVRGREVQWQLLQDHLDMRAIREEQALPAGGEARQVAGRGRVERGHERKLATVFGPVTVRRLAFRAPGPQRLPGRRRAVAADGAALAQPRAAARGSA